MVKRFFVLPVVVQSAIELRISGETGVGKSYAANGAEKTSFVVEDIRNSHNVSVANRTAANSAYFQFGHSHRFEPSNIRKIKKHK